MRTWMLMAGTLALAACQAAPEAEIQADAEPAAEVMAGEFEGVAYGEPLTLTTVTPVSVILDQPDDFVGEPVMIEGVVSAVCDAMGCWMNIEGEGEGETLQVKVDDGVIVFPQEATGQRARVEGVVEKIETIYRVKAHGAIIAE